MEENLNENTKFCNYKGVKFPIKAALFFCFKNKSVNYKYNGNLYKDTYPCRTTFFSCFMK